MWYLVPDVETNMKQEKQKRFLEVMAIGKYKIDTESGVVYSFRKSKGWEVMRPNRPKNGYLQYKFFFGRRDGTPPVLVYGHVAVWISVSGEYEEGMEVNHKDLIKTNNGIGNLELVTAKRNIEHFLENDERMSPGGVFTIRGEEIDSIKFYLRAGEKNHSKIARELGLKRSAVRYTIKKIESGEPLKYEKSLTN